MKDKGVKALTEPLSKKEQLAMAERNDGVIEGVVRMNLEDFIDNDFEDILDMMIMSLVGHIMLSDIQYEVVGFEENNVLLIKVVGVLDNYEDGEDDDGEI